MHGAISPVKPALDKGCHPLDRPQGRAKSVCLRALAQRLQVDEVVVITWTHDPKAQRRSYELLAREFDLAGTARPKQAQAVSA